MPGYAHFVEPTVLDVGGRFIRAKSIVIATGSRPWVPLQWRSIGKRLLTSDDLFELDNLPSSLAVIGLGAVGLELSQALSRLGVKVTAFGRSSFIGGLDDPAVSRRAVEIIGEEFRLLQGHAAVIDAKNKTLTVSSGHRRLRADKVLVAVGRRPNIESLRLEGLGIKVTPEGLPEFDPATMQFGEHPIFWAGDVSADRPVLHEALDAGRIAGYNAVHAASSCFARRARLRITFCQPNIASIGPSWESLKGGNICVGEADFREQGRAVIMSQDAGLLRVYAHRRTGELLGAQLAAPDGEHLAHLLAMAIQRGMTVFEALETPFYHPVLEEGLKHALSVLADRIRSPRRS
jgi:dihydrolipoamide dehydrogenase